MAITVDARRLVLTPAAARFTRVTAWGFAALAVAVVAFRLRPSVPTDDTYAWLDWGRDLRHGHVPALDGWAFHPLLVAAGTVFSLFGAAAPSLVAVLSLVALIYLAAAAWRLVRLLGVGQPAPVLAAVLVIASPTLRALAFVAYNDILFAALVVWGVVFTLEGRYRAPVALFTIAGLIRPEAWVCMFAFCAIRWVDHSTPRGVREWAPCLLAPVLWLGSEWLLLGNPLYTFDHMVGTATSSNGGPGVFLSRISGTLTWPVIAFGLVGVGVVWHRSPSATARRLLALVGATVAPLLVMLMLGFPLPGRHLAATAGFAAVIAAIGVVGLSDAVFRLQAEPTRPRRAAAVVLGIVIAGALAQQTWRSFRHLSTTIQATRSSVTALATVMQDGRLAHAIADEPHGTVALLGTSQRPELVWTVGGQFSLATIRLERGTRVIVEPSYSVWLMLKRLDLTMKTLWRPTAGWRLVAAGSWRVYVRSGLPWSGGYFQAAALAGDRTVA